MATDPAIGMKIKKRRQILGMTQEELAGHLKVAKSTVANWERGRHFPLRYLGAIEHALGITLEEDGKPEAPTEPAEHRLWELLDYMDDGERWRVIVAYRQAQREAG